MDIVSHFGPFIPEEQLSSTHRIGGWVDPTADLEFWRRDKTMPPLGLKPGQPNP